MYYRPENINDAIATLSKGELTIAAGCTDLFPTTQEDSLGSNILDISAIKSLRTVSIENGFRRIGSGTTWSDLENEELPNCYEMLKECSSQVGSRQIQNVGTIGGNLCNASPAADGVPCLLSLDASIELISINGKRILKLEDFIKGLKFYLAELNYHLNNHRKCNAYFSESIFWRFTTFKERKLKTILVLFVYSYFPGLFKLLKGQA